MTTLAPRFPGAHLLTMLRDPLRLVEQMAAVDDDVVRVRVGPRSLYLMNGPEPARTLLSYQGDGLRKERALRLARVVFGQGLLTSEGELHRRQRRRLQPVFRQRAIDRYTPGMARHLRTAIDRWRPGDEIDVLETMTRLTTGILSDTLFGGPLPQPDAFLAAAGEAGRQFVRYRNPLAEQLERLPVPSTLRLRSARRVLRRTARAVLARRGASAPVPEALDGCPHEQTVDEAVTLLLAGHETAALALTWSWLLLSRYPEVEAGLHRALDDALDGRPPGADDLSALDCADRVVREAMRLYPPVWAVSRETTRYVRLGETTYRPGAVLMVAPTALHRDPRFWRDPERFDPARFSRGEPGAQFVYLPFSAGRRGCIGEPFAWRAVVLTLATIASRWRLRIPDGGPVPLRASITLRPGRPIRARLEAREPWD